MRHHECIRFDRRGIDCPFRKAKVEEDEEEEKEPVREPEAPDEREDRESVLIGERRKGAKDNRQQRLELTEQAAKTFIVAHSQKEVREAVERMHAFQNEGLLPSIPPVGQFQNFLTSRFSELDPQRTIAIFAAIAISAFLLRQGRITSPRALSSVLAGETLVASQLRGLGEKPDPDQEFAHKMRANVRRQARRVGQVDELKRLKLGGLAFGDEFNETGF